MKIQGAISVKVFFALPFALFGAVYAQTNPLYEHRQALGAPGGQSVLTGTARSGSQGGRVVLDIPSARLVNDGVKSGDPVQIDLGTHAIRAYIGFSDELERVKRYYEHTQIQSPVEPGVILVVDRLHPAEPIALDSSAGGASMHLGVSNGQRVDVRYFRANGRVDAPTGAR